MKRKTWMTGLLVVGMLLMAVWPVLGAVSPEEKSRNIELIIEKSGIAEQLAAIPATLEQQFQKNKDQDERTQKVAAIVSSNFAVENLLALIRQTFAKQYNEKYTQEVLKFYNSDLGVKMAGLEVTASAPGFQEKVNDFDIGNYDKKRRGIVTKLFDDMKVVDIYYALSASIYESAILSVNALLPEGKKIPAATIAAYKKKIKDQFYSEENKQKLLAEFYIMYETATDDELVDYAKFSRSKSGRWVNQCIETGMIDGFKQCTEKMVTELVEFSKSQPDNTATDGEEEAEEEYDEDQDGTL